MNDTRTPASKHARGEHQHRAVRQERPTSGTSTNNLKHTTHKEERHERWAAAVAPSCDPSARASLSSVRPSSRGGCSSLFGTGIGIATAGSPRARPGPPRLASPSSFIHYHMSRRDAGGQEARAWRCGCGCACRPSMSRVRVALALWLTAPAPESPTAAQQHSLRAPSAIQAPSRSIISNARAAASSTHRPRGSRPHRSAGACLRCAGTYVCGYGGRAACSSGMHEQQQAPGWPPPTSRHNCSGVGRDDCICAPTCRCDSMDAARPRSRPSVAGAASCRQSTSALQPRHGRWRAHPATVSLACIIRPLVITSQLWGWDAMGWDAMGCDAMGPMPGRRRGGGAKAVVERDEHLSGQTRIEPT